MSGIVATAEALIGSDVFIDHLRLGTGLPVRRGWYSSITRAELFSSRNVNEDGLERMLGFFEEVEVSRTIATRAGRVRREHGMALPDAVIAATALSLGVPLATRNKKHFEHIRGLKLAKI